MNSLETTSQNRDAIDDAEKKVKSVLIVMPETSLFAGEDFVGNTIFTLACALSSAGHKVSLLVMDHGALSKDSILSFTKRCADATLNLRYIVRDKYVHLSGQKCACDSYLLFQWLSENEHFDVVHVPECKGLGYYSQLARRQGLAFERTIFVVGIFGPTLLAKTFGQSFINAQDLLAIDFLERQSARLADAIFAPLPLYLDILKDWELPSSQYRLQYDTFAKTKDKSDSQSEREINEIVYLGVMEERDGISLFCDSLDKMSSDLPPSCRVTFLGSSSLTVGRDAEAYIKTRAREWPWEWKFIHSEKPGESLEYLKAGSRLAVLGSSTISSLLLAYQCAANQVPVLCNSLSAQNVDTEFASLTQFFFADASQLANSILELQQRGCPLLARSPIMTEHRRWWVDAHQNIFDAGARTKDSGEKTANPLVSICMAHYNRPHYLRTALESLKHQDYQNIEVIVADDGSTAEGAQEDLDKLETEIADRNWRILRLPHRNVGATRSAAAQAARGEYLLFMDDDNYAHPHEVSTLVKIAANTDADIVTCFFDAFEGDVLPEADERPAYRKVFLGAADCCGLTENVFGDANALIRRSLYFELGGFEDSAGVAWHDWAFFARAVLRGFNLQVAPVPLLWYRVTETSMNRTSSEWRSAQSIIREYAAAMPETLKQFPSLLYGLVKQPGAPSDPAVIEMLKGAQKDAPSQFRTDTPTGVEPVHLMSSTIININELKASDETTSKVVDAPLAGAMSESVEKASVIAPAAVQINAAARQTDYSVLTTASQDSTSLKDRLASNKALLYTYWFLTWQLPLRLHERKTAQKIFEARVKQLALSDLFDERWYRSKYGAAISDPISHYLTTGAAAGLEPGPGFSTRWYFERYPEAGATSMTPLEHYLQYGIPAALPPCPEADPLFKDFDEDWYIERNPDIAQISISPFAHYVLYGKAEGRAPNQKREPIANFDPDWYVARYPEILEENLNPLEHYISKGQADGKAARAEDDPEGIGFDEAWYCQRYSDLAEIDLPPLMHYLIYGRKEGRLKRPLDGPNTVAKTLRERFPEQEPLRVFAVSRLPRRVTLMLDVQDDRLMGRAGTVVVFAAQWAEHLGTTLRIVSRNQSVRAALIQNLLAVQQVKVTQPVEFTTYNDNEDNSQLPVGPEELFVSASWEDTSCLAGVIPPERIVYFLQEDERTLYGAQDEYLRCSEMLMNKKIRFVVNTKLLLEHFIQQGFSHFKTNAISFEPAFPDNLFYKEENNERSKKNFFFYARPDNPANIYYRGLEVIGQALEQQLLRHADWNFHFFGSDLPVIKLPGGATPTRAQDLDWVEYSQLLRATDLGLFLSLTPHPGYPALELAACGAVVVTNKYAIKDSLETYSPNIICAEPTVEELVKAIGQGIALVKNKESRKSNYARTSLNRNWETTLKPVFQKLANS